ncbi:RNA polymerase subunit sigma [Clostridium sp. P21]|uniref:RNA polymerase subunit sigma n=1 Tax=Clostridium muellerianum TaxID=2716538 RepID=A0A7Y0EL47_9CLOT|nr:RNA polymerase subunit sigma [Clostridium muellerianum]NMM65498.1 RNA polymerase subunit sigma [Clostridium muellerianum]
MLDKIEKMKIGDKEYSFKMTNKTVLKIDEKYGNYGTVLAGIMEAKQFYTNALKILSCSCIEKEWEFDELVEEMTGEQLQSTSNFVVQLYFNYIGVEKKKTDKEDKNKIEKN